MIYLFCLWVVNGCVLYSLVCYFGLLALDCFILFGDCSVCLDNCSCVSLWVYRLWRIFCVQFMLGWCFLFWGLVFCFACCEFGRLCI